MELLDLKKIGLTNGEVKLYSALLELGESTRTILAKKSGISPSKIYDVANRLLEKGIISSVTKNGIIHFSAANPERIKQFIEQKEQDVQKEKQIVEQILPSLLARYGKTEAETDIEVFYGWEGMKTAYSDIIKKLSQNDCNYIFGASPGKNSKAADNFFSWYYQRIARKGFKVNIIFNENLRGQERTKHYTSSQKYKIRYLYQDTFAELNLYKNNVLIVMLLEKPIVVRIKSQEAADSFKTFFDTMWKLAKE